jgi:hypothetical protein
MAEFILIKGKEVEVPVDVLEAGRDAVEAFHATTEAGQAIPAELVTATDAEKDSASIESARAARTARLAKLAAWAAPIADKAKADREKAREKKTARPSSDRGAAPQEK